MNRQKIIAISGVKNSGKTTLITKLIQRLKEKGLIIATIKHDGHDFTPDVEGTDSFKHRVAGAYGTAIFSNSKWMVIKEENEIPTMDLVKFFPEANLIILEGFKYSDFPKVEIVRKSISNHPVSKPETVIAYISDLDILNKDIIQFSLDDIDGLSDYLYNFVMSK